MATKYTKAFFVFGVVIGLVLTPQRQVLRNRWFWMGAFSAFLVFLLNFVWLIQHDFPFVELMQNVRESGRDVVRRPVEFVADQAMILNPVLFPLWFAGLMWIFFASERNRYRVLGWTYLALLVSIVLKGKKTIWLPCIRCSLQLERSF